jgi:uncharacterized protein (DUF1697 family)
MEGMPTYVAFLRGVNLGSHRSVSMPRLAELARELGYDDVWTWVNSGNLVLTTKKPPTEVEREVADALEREHGTRIDVMVRTAEQLRTVLASNPFPDGSASQVTVAFLAGPPAEGAEQRLAEAATPREAFRVSGREVWVHYADGLARSRLAAGFSRIVGVSSTTRTLGTVTKIVAKIDARGGAGTAQ